LVHSTRRFGLPMEYVIFLDYEKKFNDSATLIEKVIIFSIFDL
jgi:hypothetical protein